GDRAFALNAYSAASGFYRRALGLVAGEDERGQLLFGLGSALDALADPEAAGHLSEASEALRAEGDLETAAEAECALADLAFRTGDATGVDVHAGRAVELVRGRPPSAAHAHALSQAARFQMLGGHPSESIETGVKAEQMATALGLDAIRADVLATVGTSRAGLGDPQGDADLETAIELAEAANAPLPLSRALNNLAWRYSRVDARRGYELMARNYEVQRRYGHAGQMWWARGQLALGAFDVGRWDEALEHVNAVIAHVEAGTPHYIESTCRLDRAAVLLARDDAGAFDSELERALELAAGATDPQARAPIAFDAAYFRLWARDRAVARQLLDAGLEYVLANEFAMDLVHYEASLVAVLLDLDPRELGIPPVMVADTPGLRATAALLERDLVGAAEALAELGDLTDEAYLRLRGGERLLDEGDTDAGIAQVERALEFYRGVRATRFVAEAEALLGSTRRRSA
ncbi:MAG TPA: hypothetical protein VLA22_01200, partial [Gaiellaceae bacterium]|nr:hypothetical protein [Gaiellaceae bacterium]